MLLKKEKKKNGGDCQMSFGDTKIKTSKLTETGRDINAMKDG